ncbi:MAG: iron-sulfur cluster assembly scaffold protein [Robiginitomaculum sp.]|nr:iron-sulfur cluster assembly scaffold protein [Robiginitomaculum sp.]
MDVLSLAANIQNTGRLDNPHGTARKVSKLCGSWVEVDVNIEGGMVSGFAIRLQACALGQASCAILSENIIGASKVEIETARDALLDMLKNKGTSPKGRFAKLSLLADIANYPARHTSTMLAFDVAVEAVAILGHS